MITKIVRTVSSIIFVLSVIFGIYVIINGHLTPGGGFQGGAIIASGFVLLLVAHNYDALRKHKDKFSAIESFGLIMFITIAFLGMKFTFFDNFLAAPTPYGPNPGKLFSAGVIPLMNISVGIEVLAALTFVAILMSKEER